MGRPLSVVGYERWHRRTKDGPSVTAIVLRFGWARARDLAGVAPPQHEALQEGEILESLVRLWRSRNRAPSRSEWVAWKDRICSYDTAQRVVGGNWEHIRARALALHPDLPQLSTRSTALLDLLKVPRESLRPRESEIASLAEGGKTLGQIGKHLHLTRERVRQIASRAARRTGVVAPKPKSSSYRPAYRGKAEMVALLRQRYDDLGHIPTVMEWNSSHWSPSVATLVTWFGSWRDAWVAALGEGHEDVQLMGKGRRHSLSA